MKRLKIAFFGSFDSTNFGNEITLQAVLYQLRRYLPDAEVAAITTAPAATNATHQIDTIAMWEDVGSSWRPRNSLLRLARRILIGIPSEPYRWIKALIDLRGTDLLVIPGTGLLTDAYGIAGWGPYSLLKWAIIAKSCRCRLLFVSVGAGPIDSSLGKWLVKSVLSFADFRSYRDNSTKQYLKGIGFPTDSDPVYPDLAFSLPGDIIPNHYTEGSRRTTLGINVMAYSGLYSTPRLSNRIYLSYLESLASVVRWSLAREDDVRLLIGDVADVGATQGFKVALGTQSGYLTSAVLLMTRSFPRRTYCRRLQQLTF